MTRENEDVCPDDTRFVRHGETRYDKREEGDEVVIGPYTALSKNLKDGMKVKVVPKDKLFEK